MLRGQHHQLFAAGPNLGTGSQNR